MPEGDYYAILGIDRDADLTAIKKAYRRAAIRFHPDKNPGDAEAEARFKDAAEAYSVLSDATKRRTYDQFGKAGLGGASGGRGFDQEIFSDFSDILGDLFGFGGRRRGGRGRAGRDLRYDLEIEFVEAMFGLETQIKVPFLDPCKDCGGSGAEKDGIENCRPCGGQGQVAFQQGFFTISRACGSCGGSGRRIVKPCRRCDGSGKVHGERDLQLKIPAGVDTGTRMRMSGLGESGSAGAPPGDLYVFLTVRDHDVFTREDRNLHCNLPISFAQAALGTELEVPTLEGQEKLTVPAGTQPGASFCLKGKGVPSVNGGRRGDLYVTLHVRTPTRLTDEQRRLFEQLAEVEGEVTLEPGLFDRVRSIFS